MPTIHDNRYLTPVNNFSVLTLPGLSGWWRANAITGVADGGSVSPWPDSSGLGHNASSASPGTYRANAKNGLPVVEFNGTTNSLLAVYAMTYPVTYIYVVKVLGNPGSPSFIIGDNTSLGTGCGISTSGQVRPFFGTAQLATQNYGTANFRLCIVQVAATGVMTGYLDGVALSSNGGNTGTNALGGVTLGATHGGGPVFCQLAEVIVAGGLTTKQLDQTTLYLNVMWGLSAALP